MEKNQKKNANESKFRGLMSSNEFPKETKQNGHSKFSHIWDLFGDDLSLSVPKEFFDSENKKNKGKPSSPL